MELKFKRSESIAKPLDLEIGKRTVFLRKNIKSVSRTDSDGNVTVFWTYEEAKLTPEKFNEYANCLAVKSALSGDDNQFVIMEAIADLYDAIAKLQLGGAEE